MRKRALGQLRQVGPPRQSAAHTPDGVLDTPFLPERMGIAEESLDAEGVKLVMAGELRPVVKIDCLPSLTRESTQDLGAMLPAVGQAVLTGDRRAMRRRVWRSSRVKTACP